MKILLSSVRYLESNNRITWFLLAIYALVIFYFSSLSYIKQPVETVWDMAPIEHIAEYAVFGFLVLLALKSKRRLVVSTVILAILLGIFYGIADEIHQMFVPGRISSIFDVTMDSIGSVLGVMYSSCLVMLNDKQEY